MSYLLRRLKSVAVHLLTPRGGLLSLAAIAAVVALTASSAKLWSSIAAVGILLVALVLLSARQTEDHASTANLRKDLQAVTSDRQAPRTTVEPSPATASARETNLEDELARAKTVISAARVGLLSGLSAQPTVTTSGSAAPPRSSGPRVTIVVPCYNEARFLAETLASVLMQSFEDWECVIVDDASTDASLSEAMRFTDTDERFRLVVHRTNSGLSAARNTGLRLARGEFVTFLDSDDLLMTDSIMDRLETFAGAGPDTAGTYCGVRLAPEDVSLDSLNSHEDWRPGPIVDFVSAGAECPFNAHAPLLLTEIVQAVGGFDESMRDGAEDWELWLRILRRGYVFIPSKWRTAIYRQKLRSMAKDRAERHVRVAQQLIARSYEYDPSVGGTRGASEPFPSPLHVYQQQLVVARRTLQYAATSSLLGNREAAHSILNVDGVVIEPWMDRHIGFDNSIDAGFRRALGVTQKDVRDLSEALEPLHRDIRGHIPKPRPRPSREEMESPGRHDTLFVPENAAQAKVMLDVADNLPPEHLVAFLNVEQVAGTQGAFDLLLAAPWPTFSINEWVLTGREYRNLVVAYPRSGFIEELVATTVNAGGRAAELAMEGTDVMRVDEGRLDRKELLAMEPVDLAGWLVDGISISPQVEAIGGSSRSLPLRRTTSFDVDVSIDEYPNTTFDSAQLEQFKNIHKGERCILIGNGPSLNKLDLQKLKSEVTFGVNGIFYATDQMGFDPTYYVVEDTMVMQDNVDAIRAYAAGHKFFPSIYRHYIGEAPNVTYFMMNRGFYAENSPSFCVPRFSVDAAQRLYCGQSVTIINLQLAYYMGFEEVILIGMDFSYTVPEDAEVDGALILSMGDDPNHFHPDYFGKGKTWKDPKLDRVLSNYQLAKLMFEADGRRIINATPGGRLELFKRVPYTDLFK